MSALLEVALSAHAAGICVVAPAEDGSKRPSGRWKKYQTQRPTEDELRAAYTNGRTGIGYVCGEVSGHLEMLELEGRAVAAGLVTEVRAALAEAGLTELMRRIVNGYSETTPTDGMHLAYRCEEPIDGNLKLAFSETGEVLIETRGQGGYFIAAPSHGTVHPHRQALGPSSRRSRRRSRPSPPPSAPSCSTSAGRSTVHRGGPRSHPSPRRRPLSRARPVSGGWTSSSPTTTGARPGPRYWRASSSRLKERPTVGTSSTPSTRSPPPPTPSAPTL